MASRSGPKSATVVRIGTPVPRPPSEYTSTGYAVGLHSWPIDAARSTIFADDVPGTASPDRSPLTSARNTGTPAADRPSAMPWSVFVLPVPVAPATSPCRLSIESANPTWTSARGDGSPPSVPSSSAPSGSVPPAYA